MAEISIEHGEVVFLHELPALLQRLDLTKQPKALRVLGRCVGARPRQHRVGLADRAAFPSHHKHQQPQGDEDEDMGETMGSLAGAQLLVDTALLASELAFAVDSLYQVIGELQPPPPGGQEGDPPVLRARVARCVDGMDVSLWEQAVRLRRGFLQRTAALAGEGEQGGSRPGTGAGGAVPMAVDGMN